MNVHDITKEFEKAICEYTGAPYCVAVDSASNAIDMCLLYSGVKNIDITIPSNTYPSVPAEIKLSGNNVVFDNLHESLRELNEQEKQYFINFYKSNNKPENLALNIKMLTGAYQLKPLPIWDSALRFTADMYLKDQFQVLSFTGQWKALKTCKGGAILTDSKEAYLFFKRYRFSGRNELSYHLDYFDCLGKNYYLHPVFATIGLQFIDSFRNFDGSKKDNPDLILPYPDLSQMPAYK